MVKKWWAIDSGNVARFAKRVFLIDSGSVARLIFATQVVASITPTNAFVTGVGTLTTNFVTASGTAWHPALYIRVEFSKRWGGNHYYASDRGGDGIHRARRIWTGINRDSAVCSNR